MILGDAGLLGVFGVVEVANPNLIDIAMVKDFCPAASNLSDFVISMYIDMVEQSDDCLTAYGLSDNLKNFYKLTAICHLLTAKFGGQVTSQTDFDDASISFAQYQSSGSGLSSSTFGREILASPYSACFGFMNSQSSRFVASVGRSL